MIVSPFSRLICRSRRSSGRMTPGRRLVSYTSPGFLAQRYTIPSELVKNIAGVEPLLTGVLKAQCVSFLCNGDVSW